MQLNLLLRNAYGYVKSSVYRTSSILHLSVVHFVNDKDDGVVPGLGL